MERVCLLLVLPVSTLALLMDYYGASVSFSPRLQTSDSVSMEFSVGYSGENCEGFSLRCERDQCGTRLDVHRSRVVVGGVCRVALVQTQTVPNTMHLITMSAQWTHPKPSWPLPSVNSVVNVSFSVVVDLRTRSDTGTQNSSPLSSVLPVIRIPWNCPRDLDLLTVDPDQDLVQCRFADNTIDPRECQQCTPPSVLSLHLVTTQSCRLSFSSSNSSSLGLYVVQMVLEDFPRADIVLTQTDGTQEERKTTQGLSKTPVQFLLSVEEEVPSCLPGLYVPVFEAPTPASGAWINVTVTQTLSLHIQTRANLSTLWALWFSGPAGMTQTHTRSEGQYLLSWRPSAADVGRPVPVCFMVLADLSGVRLSSEFRCVVVNVAEVQLMAAAPLSEDDMEIVLKQFKETLVKEGIPSSVVLRLLEYSTAPPDGST